MLGRQCSALVLGLALSALAPAPGRAQEAPGTGTPAPAAEAGAPSAEVDKELAELRTRLEEWKARSAEFARARDEAPARLEAIEQEIAELQKRDAIVIDPNASLAELGVQLATAEQDLSVALAEPAAIDAEAARRSERRKKIPELLSAAKEKLRKLEAAPPLPGAAAGGQVVAAGELERLRRAVLEAEIEAYQNELGSYDARGVLLGKRRDRATLRISYLEALASRLRDTLKAREQSEAERQAQAARESLADLTDVPPAVRDIVRGLAEQNQKLAEERTGEDGLVEKIDEVSRKLARVEQQVAGVEADFANLREKVDVAGLTDSVGLVLRRQRANAPEVGKYRRFIRMRRELIGAVQLHQIELRDQRRELADIDGLVQEVMNEIEEPLPAAESTRLAARLRQLFETQRQLLDALIDGYEVYFQKLVDFDAGQQELIERTTALIDFIDERILWIPSGEVVEPKLLSDGAEALRWLLSPRYGGQLVRAFDDALRGQPLANALVALVFVLALAFSPRLRRDLRRLGEQARSTGCIHYGPTAVAFAFTLLLAPWPPGLLSYLAWRVELSPEATQYARCIASGALAAAFVWLTLRIARQILRPAGLGEAHFGWPTSAVRRLRRHLSWLTAVLVPAVFLIQVFEVRGEELWTESVGRLVFVVAMLATVVFTHLVTRERGALPEILRCPPIPRVPPWVWRLVHALAVAVPVLLLAAALRGYYWTALQLATRLHLTLVFLFLLLVAFHLFARWSLLAARRLALDRLREQQEAAAAKLAEQRALGEVVSEASEVSEETVDLATVSSQTSRLSTGTTLFLAVIGLWAIWADVMPAAGILRRVELWSVTQSVQVQVPDASGAVRLTSERRVVPVTLADLLLALAIAVAALALVRNLPGLLEVSLFRRLGAGERYAYATIVKYAVTIAAVALAFDMVGVGWSSIQWLVAAIGLGLGFGLQEIFANFVSGLIILFERPIRVGDTVTVGEVSGTVSRIRIRATWITGFDRKELVVPNKEFVTGRLVNWSLTDATLRIEIPVGIAYGSDTERAIRVLRRVAQENDQVMRDPPPQVLFLGFGDSSLSFELRVFSPDVAHFLTIKHQLHLAIDRAFREEGIEIAFPQRDLHLRSLPTGWPAPPPPVGGDG